MKVKLSFKQNRMKKTWHGNVSSVLLQYLRWKQEVLPHAILLKHKIQLKKYSKRSLLGFSPAHAVISFSFSSNKFSKLPCLLTEILFKKLATTKVIRINGNILRVVSKYFGQSIMFFRSFFSEG